MTDPSFSFIDPTARISGSVELGQDDYVGPFVRVEAGAAFTVRLSDQVNLQDQARISATAQNILIGERTSIAHGAQIVNSSVGNFVFVGFNAVVENAVLADGAMVLHGAHVCGVTIPKDRVVSPGAVLTEASQTLQLPKVTEANHEFKEEVISVNVELSAGYRQLGQDPHGLPGVSSNPKTSWNAAPQFPILGQGVDLAQAPRIIGSVQLGEGSSVGKMTSIRGDEGTPIVIGKSARIGERVTFHSLKDQTIVIGNQLSSGDGVVFHGALTLGEQVSVGNQVVLFKSMVGYGCTIGNNALVIGVNLAAHSRIPEGAVVLDQQQADLYAPQGRLPSAG